MPTFLYISNKEVAFWLQNCLSDLRGAPSRTRALADGGVYFVMLIALCEPSLYVGLMEA